MYTLVQYSFFKQKFNHFFFILHHQKTSQQKLKKLKNELKLINEKEEIQIIIHYWIRTLNIKLGWIKDFDKFVVNYAYTIFMFDTFRSSSKLIDTFTGHTSMVYSIDYSTFDDYQFICSGSDDTTVRLWDVDNNKQIKSFNKHLYEVDCVKFSSYHYYNHRQYVICSSSWDKTIRFWEFKHDCQLQIFKGHTRMFVVLNFHHLMV
ncbi:F-box and wd40 domain protein, partial [Reticulomyxa filosa]